MSNTLEYGINTDGQHNRLYVDVPAELAAKIQEEQVTLSNELQELNAKKTRILDIEPNDGALRVYVNSKKIGNRHSDQNRRQAARRVAGVITWIDMFAEHHQKDPGMSVQMGDTYSSDGRLGMVARLRWPSQATDQVMSQLGTYFMKDTARKLNYERKMIDELVYCGVLREQGIIIETNPLGSCNISAGGDYYDASEPTVELWQHNIYSPVQQLICFAGAIAVAKADKLEIPTDLS